MKDKLQHEPALLPPQLRSVVYEMFASGFTTLPTQQSLKSFQDFGSSLAHWSPADSYFKLASVAAKRREMDSGNNLDTLAQDFYDLFFVPSSGRYAVPFESGFIRNELWGPETAHCADCYNAVKFSPRELDVFAPLKEACIPDHIGFQLGFVAFLAKAEHDAKDDAESASWRNLQLQFLRGHLLNWVPRYASRLTEGGTTFYSVLAAALVEYLTEDVAAVQEIDRKRGELH